MAKRNLNETEEERKARKRAKKEAKRKREKQDENDSALPNKTTATEPVATATQESQLPRGEEPPKCDPFFRKEIQMTVSLLPGALRNLSQSIDEAVRHYLLRYSQGIGGILLAYENLKLVTDSNNKGKGLILNDLPHIHYHVCMDALVFCPEIGFELHGVVRECFESHVGILIMGYFNAMVSAEDLHAAGFMYDSESHKWVGSNRLSSNGTQTTIEEKSSVKFLVRKVHECDGMISVEGTRPEMTLLVEERQE